MTLLLNWSSLKARRQELRRAATPAEAALWHLLKGDRLGVRFHRQSGVGPYIVDFYCPRARLAIEVDGPSHCGPLMPEYDAQRQAYLESFGITVLRFANEDVLNAPHGVVAVIVGFLERCAGRERQRRLNPTPRPNFPNSLPTPCEGGGQRE